MAVECTILVDGRDDLLRHWFASAPRIGDALRFPNAEADAIVRAVTHFPCADPITSVQPTIQLQVTMQGKRAVSGGGEGDKGSLDVIGEGSKGAMRGRRA